VPAVAFVNPARPEDFSPRFNSRPTPADFEFQSNCRDGSDSRYSVSKDAAGCYGAAEIPTLQCAFPTRCALVPVTGDAVAILRAKAGVLARYRERPEAWRAELRLALIGEGREVLLLLITMLTRDPPPRTSAANKLNVHRLGFEGHRASTRPAGSNVAELSGHTTLNKQSVFVH